MADIPGRTVIPNQMRKRRLQLRIAASERVVFLIGDLGRILRVIQPVMLGDLPREPHQFVCGIGFV